MWAQLDHRHVVFAIVSRIFGAFHPHSGVWQLPIVEMIDVAMLARVPLMTTAAAVEAMALHGQALWI
jgi:hypothetical protein